MTRLIIVPREGVDGRRPYSAEIRSGSLDPLEPMYKIWNYSTYAWLTMSLAVQPQAYMFPMIGLSLGLGWKWTLVAAFVSALLVAVLGIAASHPTSKYGVPLCVSQRASYGRIGSKIYSLLFLLLALPWASFLLSIAVEGLSGGIYRMKPSSETWSPLPAGLLPPGYTFVSLLSIIGLTCLMMVWFLPGYHALSLANSASSASSTALGFCIGMAIWGCRMVGLSTSLEMYDRLINPDRSSLPLHLSLPLTILAGIGCFATLALGYGDLARWAVKRQAPKNAFLITFPLAVTATAFFGIIITGAVERGFTYEALTPTSNLKFISPAIMALATGVILSISILHPILAGYTLGAAHCIADLAPSFLTARAGGAAFIISTLVFTLFAPSSFTYNVFLPSASGRLSLPYWSQTCGLIAGGLFGILIGDYFIIRHRQLPTDYLYKTKPSLHLFGVNLGAILALLIAYSIFIIKPMMGIDYAPLGGPELLPALCFLPTFLLSMLIYLLTYRCFSSPPAPAAEESSSRPTSQQRAATALRPASQQSASERATHKLTQTLHQLLNDPNSPAPSAPPAADIEEASGYYERPPPTSPTSRDSLMNQKSIYSIPVRGGTLQGVPLPSRSSKGGADRKGAGRRSSPGSSGEESKEMDRRVPYANAVNVYDSR